MAKRTEANRGQSQQTPDSATGDTVDRMPSPDRGWGGGSVDSDDGGFGWSNDSGGRRSGPDGDQYSDSELLH